MGEKTTPFVLQLNLLKTLTFIGWVLVAPKANPPGNVLPQEAAFHHLETVPNYQQTPVELRRSPVQEPPAVFGKIDFFG